MGQVEPEVTLTSHSLIDDRTDETRRRDEFLRYVASRSGAVVLSRRTFEQANGELGGYAFQMPIFVLTRRALVEAVKARNDQLCITFVSDGIESAVARARLAAGGKDVAVIGDAKTAQQLIRAGLVDELNLDVVPVLIGQRLRFFQYEDSSDRVPETPVACAANERADRRFRVIKPTLRLQPTRFTAWV